MNLWSILWQSTVIFLCIYVPVKYFQVRVAKKKMSAIMTEKIKNWKPVYPPENEKYIIVKAKELLDGDIIIHFGLRFKIAKCGCGLGAGSYEFGEYFWIEGEFINTNPTNPFPLKGIWFFQESPTIKCVSE